MRYHVVYLLAGERRTIGVEAADAASAVAALTDRTQARFELLAVLRSELPRASHRSRIASDGRTMPLGQGD